MTADEWEPSEEMWAACDAIYNRTSLEAALKAVRPLLIAEARAAWQDRMLEVHYNARAWMVAHDKLLAGEPYEYPKPLLPSKIKAQIEAEERERIAHEFGKAGIDWAARFVRALKDSKP